MDRRWVPWAMVVLVPVVVGSGALLLRARGDHGKDGRAAPAYAPVIDPAQFTANVDNEFFPLRPGTRWEYEGSGDEGGVEHNVVEVTHDTRTIMGVRCVVVHDTVTVDGALTEDTFDWYAQDQLGNVWYFGEDTSEYREGKPVSHEGAWEGGVHGAQPGMVMPAVPRVGFRYRQEYSKGQAEDEGEILRLDAQVSVPYGSFDGVLETKDFTPLEPDVVEHKFYARGVGVVRELTVEGGSGHAELVKVTTT